MLNIKPLARILYIDFRTLSLPLFMLRGRIIVLLFIVLCFAQRVQGQGAIPNMPEHDNKQYYFGITFGTNFSQYRFKYSESFQLTDSFKQILSTFRPGFNLGIMGNLRLNNRFDLRTVPSLSFAEKRMYFNMRSSAMQDSISDRSIESIYMHLPVQLKFKSDRIVNFRFYALGGMKFDFDLAANARSRRADEFIKVKPFDMGYEIGAGFEFYYPNFIFSPEIKLSQGLMNQQFRDPKIPLSNALDGINTRMIVISIHLEG